MALRNLGSTGLQVSPIGWGTVKLGRDQQVKYPTGFTLPDDRQAATLLALARELGINLLDTAPAYGTSEERLGQLLGKQRQDWIICTKVGEEFTAGESRFDFTPTHTRFSLERSLRRLRTDYLDLVLVHSDGRDEELIERYEVFDQLEQFKRAGWIRAYGMSTKTVTGGLLTARHADVVMVTYNPWHLDEVSVIDECHQLNKGVLIKKALASGHLDKEASAATADPVQASLQLVLNHPGVSSAIVGTINPQHLRDNVAKALRALNLVE